MLAKIYWALYRRVVEPALPEGGVDMFACNKTVVQHLLQFHENPNSMIGLLFWVGFRRAVVPYARRKQMRGGSAWTVRKRFGYFADTVFAFTDLPIRLLIRIGLPPEPHIRARRVGGEAFGSHHGARRRGDGPGGDVFRRPQLRRSGHCRGLRMADLREQHASASIDRGDTRCLSRSRRSRVDYQVRSGGDQDGRRV